MSRAVGGRFSAFSGYATGVNVELVKDRKIVQTWRASDWPKGAESTVAFSLTKSRGGKTRLTFSQAGVPDEFVKEITQGWHDNYWKPLREYLAQ
jgi:activator of HSP90 ATPase